MNVQLFACAFRTQINLRNRKLKKKKSPRTYFIKPIFFFSNMKMVFIFPVKFSSFSSNHCLCVWNQIPAFSAVFFTCIFMKFCFFGAVIFCHLRWKWEKFTSLDILIVDEQKKSGRKKLPMPLKIESFWIVSILWLIGFRIARISFLFQNFRCYFPMEIFT